VLLYAPQNLDSGELVDSTLTWVSLLSLPGPHRLLVWQNIPADALRRASSEVSSFSPISFYGWAFVIEWGGSGLSSYVWMRVFDRPGARTSWVPLAFVRRMRVESRECEQLPPRPHKQGPRRVDKRGDLGERSEAQSLGYRPRGSAPRGGVTTACRPLAPQGDTKGRYASPFFSAPFSPRVFIATRT
jgi:hypothetical protein